MIIVTGGAGFIGSNLVRGLNEKGREDILIVDNLTNGEKCKNMNALKFNDYIDKETFKQAVIDGYYDEADINAVFHIGACSDTMEYNGRYMMDNNYEYSKALLHFCLDHHVPFIYASSASVYGNGRNGFKESPECEGALNVYAFSKMQFDRYVSRILPHAKSQVVGLRYFNVYGPQEMHKGRMASIVYQLYNQLAKDGAIRLFEGTDGYGNGEQRRDFIYVKDVVKVNLYFWQKPKQSGIFNCGTGQAHTFNAVAESVIRAKGHGKIEYIPFPETLQGKYQSFTEADPSKLLAAGYNGGFHTLEDAVKDYCQYLDEKGGYL
ncbi:MAG TPA: ADP-glyceromanno-heptose 6-epimerase [Methylomusa anaerophila]|uniref:ADP-L-glycero-D-manno-heptose-6-epimerase n=1 Tax=Methylomusa anaerophila TaxID=1930071 RepID=A0A348AKK9_9FIRM|nr:ADP-glyceromanno-heptose 6-epimerase [Methylomusa anaerophila]BBB91607.1 ADP-L-glycero-D-manno-heptose-6-epimerase [Methylomusa anaerophila]HML89455.1 ADP-glyceromanno-heptose 6-epimerase [Methylomusa anaerophila]